MKTFNAVVHIVTLGVLMVIAGSVAAQQSYPTKPVRFIVPYAAGSTLDVLCRLVGQKLAENWGQSVVVDDRPGGNTVIGTEAMLQSPPDGYTLMLTSSGHTLIPQLLAVSFDPIKDFAPVATISSTEFIMVVSPSLPANNLQEVIALLKTQPGQFNYASTGVGAGPHVAGELLNIMAGVKLEHVPYKGSVQALTDLVAGRVQVFISTVIVSIPFIKAGRIKAIAVSGATRLSALPDVPTFTEAGLPGFDVKTWLGILAPAKTPKLTIDRLSADVAKVLSLPDIKEKLDNQGLVPFISTPEQFAAMMKADMAKYARIIKATNIKLEN